jgi:DNA-binding response OmpR family regulator
MDTKRILVIDDDVELCEELTEALRAQGHCVENTSDSSNGVELIKKNTFDIVILDFKMPGLNGIDLLRKVKTSSSQTSVFLITGRPFIEKLLEKEKVADLVAGFIKKPFNDKVLFEKINSIDSTRLRKDA